MDISKKHPNVSISNSFSVVRFKCIQNASKYIHKFSYSEAPIPLSLRYQLTLQVIRGLDTILVEVDMGLYVKKEENVCLIGIRASKDLATPLRENNTSLLVSTSLRERLIY
tara:strand:- start:25397 stop:25729 length:333 start_codon:yes stop_codon:yes gene_type:complete